MCGRRMLTKPAASGRWSPRPRSRSLCGSRWRSATSGGKRRWALPRLTSRSSRPLSNSPPATSNATSTRDSPPRWARRVRGLRRRLQRQQRRSNTSSCYSTRTRGLPTNPDLSAPTPNSNILFYSVTFLAMFIFNFHIQLLTALMTLLLWHTKLVIQFPRESLQFH